MNLPTNGSEGEAGTKLTYNIDTIKQDLHAPPIEDKDVVPRYSLFSNYSRLASWHLVTRSHEDMNLFFMVFKPFSSNKDTTNQKRNAMDHVRKKIMEDNQVQDVIITREVLAKRVHFNAMVFTKSDLSTLHDTKTSRYMIYCKRVPYVDKYKVHEYVVKESRVRYFYSECKSRILDIYCASRYDGKYTRYYNLEKPRVELIYVMNNEIYV